MKKKQLLVLTLLLGMALLHHACMNQAGEAEASLPQNVSYNFHIRPVLSDKCFKCHGPDLNKMEAGLRLDKPEFAYAPLKETKGAFALVPGKPDSSELFRRIISEDPAYQMPTPDSHLGTLNEYEIALFRRWIEQGATYEPHWAFVPPKKKSGSGNWPPPRSQE